MSTTVVALHGFAGCGRDWGAVRAEVKSEITWICPDLFTPGSADPLTAPVFEGKAWLAGYSFGARLALRWLTGQPDRWHGALLLSVNPGNFQTDAERDARILSDRAWAEGFRRETWDVLMTKWNAQEIFAKTACAPRAETDFDREKLAAALGKFSVAGQFTDFARLTGDFIWMAGAEDAKFRALLEKMRNSGFPGSFFAVPGAGHRLLREAPSEVAAALDRLLATG